MSYFWNYVAKPNLNWVAFFFIKNRFWWYSAFERIAILSKTSVRFWSLNTLASVSVLKPVTVGVLFVWNKIYRIWSQESDLDFRKAAYRQFALPRHSKLVRDNRRVMPSCVVLHIRHAYWFALSSHLLIFRTFNYLSADTTTLGDAKKKKNRSRDSLFNRRIFVM